MEIISDSPGATARVAERLAGELAGNEIILLNGELGAGKTTFAKALLSALGVEDVVTSPTFAFMKEYTGKYRISHYDMYRAENADELFELGIAENLYEDGICVIEWNKFSELPEHKRSISIDIERLGKDRRKIAISELSK